MDNRGTAQTAPSAQPSRTGLALILFMIVIAVAGALVYWVYHRAHQAAASLPSAVSRAELQDSAFELRVDVFDFCLQRLERIHLAVHLRRLRDKA